MSGRRIPSSVTMSRALTNESTVDGSLDDDASEMELMDHQTSPDSAASDGEPALEAFLARFPSDTGEAVTSEDIAAVYDFPLDGFQREATTALLRGDSVVVSAPTGSGKTLVGETAIMTALARGQKAIYTTPLKALSNQKLREFQALFGVRRVGLKTGDVDINTADADVVVMTTEILRNMLYPRATESDGTDTSIGESASDGDGRLDDVGVVVLDEVHYLSDAYRGTVWEETIIYCPPRVQLLCLSATVGNPDDLAGWIEEVHCVGDVRGQRCRTIVSDYRPVPLNWHFSMRPGRMWPGLGPLLNRNGTKLNYELFPFTKEGAREWEAANGENHAEAPPTSGANTSQRTRLTGSTKGGSFAKSQKTNFQSSTADGKAARAGDAVNRINPVPREEGGEAGAATHGNGAAAGAAAGTARGADPSERRRRRLRIVRRGDGSFRTWRRPWGSSSPRPCYPRCGSYSAGKAATRLRSTSRTAAPSW